MEIRMIARALLASFACVLGWTCVYYVSSYDKPMQAKLLVALKTAAAAALGAVLPMLPGILADSPALAPLVSAVVTAIVLHLRPAPAVAK